MVLVACVMIGGRWVRRQRGTTTVPTKSTLNIENQRLRTALEPILPYWPGRRDDDLQRRATRPWPMAKPQAACFAEAWRLAPTDAAAGNNLAGTYLKLGRVAEARAVLRSMRERGLLIDPPLARSLGD